MKDSLYIRTQKSWQGQDPFYVFQSSMTGVKLSDYGIKKFFLILDARQDNFGIHFSPNKPSALSLTGGMVNQIRKHLKTTTIIDISKDTRNGNLWLTCRGAERDWFILLSKSRPPEIVLISSEKTVLMRFGMKGTFTKKKPWDDDLPHESERITSIKKLLIDQFLSSLTSNDEDKEDIDMAEEDSDSKLSKPQRFLIQKLKRKLKTFKKSHEKQLQKIPSIEQIEDSDKKAQLLQSFAYLAKDSDFELILPPNLTGLNEPISIELDPDKSIGSNIELQFVKAKKLKKSREMNSKICQRNEKDISDLERDLNWLETERTTTEIEHLYSKYKVSQAPQSNNKEKLTHTASPFKTFSSSQGIRILVGKGPKENDELTKSARSNDYWVHTAGVAGSHIVIPVTKQIRNEIPESLLKEAAILAIHFSKYRGDQAGEVYIARRGDIKKQKGMPPGLWNVERCKTQFFRYTKEELQKILDRMTPTN